MCVNFLALSALNWNRDGGEYSVPFQCEAENNIKLMLGHCLLHPASENAGYLDVAGIIAKREFPWYFVRSERVGIQRQKNGLKLLAIM
ncbi:hypothetical protein QN360_10990 [Glaciimonas sp. CA11.2]|uniref:hypothetical protein n=1 Tax=Glaciimonas sp. CA11.2 TaxID=3048601 RepID=UPI002AB41C6F|nr:hypothetical protein [Glaciimonas sp. CA11.2]MDY7545031.1 hypothetical protein [Glaciimonas sp. CA11.2]MEB0163430.1 hypothetical protein [Glaciimonas sp. CA11.2]